MNTDAAIDYLLRNACASIQYRTGKEILGEPVDSPQMQALQGQILAEDAVREILALRGEDGWLGGTFHGAKEPESGIRFLTEKGVEGTHPVIQDALEAIRRRGDRFDDGSLQRVGKALDACRVGGSQMIRACVFAYAGVEDDAVRTQVTEALSALEFVSGVQRMQDIYTLNKDGKPVFRAGMPWPSIYHLRLLAATQSWRTPENRTMLAAALNRLVELSPVTEMKLLYRGQMISPASFCMNDFAMDMAALGPKEWMMWFHRTELVARLGVLPALPAAVAQVDTLREHLRQNGGLFTMDLSHYYFTKWTQYLGLALERDWKDTAHRVCDLTFRSLLILKYTGLMN